MTTLVDTSVWSLLLRRDRPGESPELQRLRAVLAGADTVITTGVVMLELLTGVRATAVPVIEAHLRPLLHLTPGYDDYVAAAALRTELRARGVQFGAVDALIAQLCIAHSLTLLTTDADFRHAARHTALDVWAPR